MDLRNAMRWFRLKGRKQETCEGCGKAFVCGATLAGCWCAEVKLTDEQRTELKAKYQRCLCRECLEEFAREGRIAESRKEA